MSYQSYLDSIEKITGKTPQQIIDSAVEKGFTKETKTSEIIAWLKTDLHIGHGHAMAMAGVIKNGPTISDKHVGAVGTHADASTELRLDGIAKR
jgi:hypothetical protein